MEHAEAEDDRDCGCPIHRIRRAGRLWGWFVHAWVHPISALIVMGAAGIEVLEWARHAALLVVGGH